MTSVGYGNIIASTELGRITTCVTALIGAIYLSLLVAIVTELFILAPNKIEAIDRMHSDKSAANCVMASLKYNVARRKRNRMLISGEYEESELPTASELLFLRNRMEFYLARFRNECIHEREKRANKEHETRVEVLES
jgi:hypothetical protein